MTDALLFQHEPDHIATLQVAVVQMNSGDDKRANIDAALAGIERAAATGARLVALPEVWTYLGPISGNAAAAETIPGPLTDELAERARELGIILHCGSFFERIEGEPRLFNTSVVFGPDGHELARYRKIHLFDVDITSDTAYRESATIAPGEEIVTFDLDGITVGLAICYDIRFPELFRILALRGADVIVLPSAFTMATGKDHWEPLIRARAIENAVYMVAPGQVGQHPPGLWCHGRSMVVDPWGVIIAQASDEPTVISATLDFATQRRIREQIPSLANRLPDRYLWPEEGRLVDGVGSASQTGRA
ncbi:MAG TPA: carbon-nitrogen hydrolase family protein [Thermomicrobiales bacterium]|nr:carbon-nitrogen hydrolase family protein [Thermomicrobiales bacterium]